MNCEVAFAGIGDHNQPFSMNFHKHNCHEIVLYTQGNGYVEVLGKKYSYKPGSIGFVHSNIWHNEINMRPSKNVFIGFQYDDATLFDSGFYHANERIATLFFKIVEEMQFQKKDFSQMMSCYLKELIIEISRANTDEKKQDDFSYILNYIDENLAFEITNNLLSKMSYYSEERFRHLFKERVGCSPKQYIMEKRLLKAKNLLLEEDKSISEIADVCGFYDLAYFSKMFKKKFGTSPRKFIETTKKCKYT